MDDAPWSVVVLGFVLGSAFVAVGLMGAIDWHGWNTAQAEHHADLLRMRGKRRTRYLRSQRVLGRIVGPLFLVVGIGTAVLPALSRLI